MSDITKADLDAAIAKVREEYEARIEAIDAKKNEAIDEAKRAKQALRASQEIKPEDLAAAEERAEKAETALKEAQKQITGLTKERDGAVKALEAETGFTQKLLVENGLTEALTAAGVKEAPHLKAVKAMFAPLVQIVPEGDARVAKVGDKALADHIKDWASSDEGKFFVSAGGNHGGGAQGGGSGGGSGKSMTESDFNALNAKDRSAFMASGGQIASPA